MDLITRLMSSHPVIIEAFAAGVEIVATLFRILRFKSKQLFISLKIPNKKEFTKKKSVTFDVMEKFCSVFYFFILMLIAMTTLNFTNQ